jgi:hypothetical protein
MNRRGFLQLLGATGAAALTSGGTRINSALGTLSSPANLVRFPEKTEMILLTDRPPQLETLLHYFRQDLTPNEAFLFGGTSKGFRLPWICEPFGSTSAATSSNRCS